jgi:hypothetical protein
MQGISMCQMFNVSPNDLFYKWEAYNYSNARRPSSEFNLDSALALKAQMQRNIATQATGKLTGPQKPLLSLNRRFGASSATVTKFESESQQPAGELRAALARSHQKESLDIKSVPATKVKFARLEIDSQLKRCEFLPHVTPISNLPEYQSDICTNEYQNGAKVTRYIILRGNLCLISLFY